MKTNLKALSRSAIFSAAAVAILYLASVFPSGRLALVAIAGLSGVLAIIHCGWKWAVGVYFVSCILGLLLSPNKSNALFYLLFFGYYPALKSPIEHCRNKIVEWILKILLFNIIFCISWFLLRSLLLDGISIQLSILLLWICCNFVFIIYDIGLSQLIQMYVRNVSLKMKE